MVRVADVQRDYREVGALHALLNLYGFVDDTVFLTKSGDVGLVLAIRGVDDECLDQARREQVVQRFQAAVRLFDERVRVYQYLVKRRADPLPSDACGRPIIARALRQRAAFLDARGLYAIDLFLVIVREAAADADVWLRRTWRAIQAPGASLGRALSAHHAAGGLEVELDREIAQLRHQVDAFLTQVEDTLHPCLLRAPDAFTFLRRLVNYAPEKCEARRTAPDAFLDYAVGDSTVECHRTHLRVDDHYVRVLTLKEPPSQTFAAMLRALYAVEAECVVVTEWRREAPGPMRRVVQAKRRHFHNAKASLVNYLQGEPVAAQDLLIDDGASAKVAELGTCLRDMAVHGHYFGTFSLTVVLVDLDSGRVDAAVAACLKVFAVHDATLTDERYNLLNAWLAIVPGGAARNLRRLYLLNTNYADLSLLFTVSRGEATNPRLRSEYLAALETTQRTPYFFNLHQDDVAHTVVLGATGSGKSFFLNFLVTHLQKYDPYTVIFDLGGSYQRLTSHLGGGYLRLGVEHSAVTINPFALAPTVEHRHFLFAFVKVLLESSEQYRLTTHDDRELYEQIGHLYEVEAEQRRLLTLSHMLPRPLAQQLHRWVGAGPYAALFDHVEDTLTCARFQCFDFQGMEAYPQLLEPLLFYILHRASAAIHDEAAGDAFKVLVMDEAWRFLRNATIKHYLTEALKTWRKRNAAVVLATQSTDDLAQSEVLRLVVESCATHVFFANPGADARVYREVFGLNETEIARVAGLVPRQQLLVKQRNGAKVLTLTVDAESAALYSPETPDRAPRGSSLMEAL
jgi:type IV secretion system protein VirB4